MNMGKIMSFWKQDHCINKIRGIQLGGLHPTFSLAPLGGFHPPYPLAPLGGFHPPYPLAPRIAVHVGSLRSP